MAVTFMNAYFVLLLYVAFLAQKVHFPPLLPPLSLRKSSFEGGETHALD